MMHRSKMKDQVLVIKTNGKLGTLLDRERRDAVGTDEDIYVTSTYS